MEKSDGQSQESRAPQQPRNGALPAGLAIDYAAALADNEVALNLQVQEQLSSPRKRQRFPKIKPVKSAKQLLPTGVLGVGHLVRQRYREIAQACGQDRECWRTKIAELAARLDTIAGPPAPGG